ncbi:hypothetical protein P879_11546 [Paragonimus westermani]|uniref:Uncharacterized protein n=1 Tax=Paragonimus westermani TaxID=34504 RepID=A0A8T0D8E9_9TREM|nr:hypothetical protein P879_11546 [Paragonimus westermani]
MTDRERRRITQHGPEIMTVIHVPDVASDTSTAPGSNHYQESVSYYTVRSNVFSIKSREVQETIILLVVRLFSYQQFAVRLFSSWSSECRGYPLRRKPAKIRYHTQRTSPLEWYKLHLLRSKVGRGILEKRGWLSYRNKLSVMHTSQGGSLNSVNMAIGAAVAS